MRRAELYSAALALALFGSAAQIGLAQTPAAAPLKMAAPVRFLPEAGSIPSAAEAELASEAELAEATSAELFQPAPSTQPGARPAPDSQVRRASTSTRRPPTRLASVSHMYGDFFGGGPILTATFGNPAGVPGRQFSTQIVPPGGGRRTKIGEQNSPLPTDRVFFFYNHFENARSASDVTGREFRFPIDRYTVGVEKTVFDGLASVEFRMPFSNSFDFTGNPANPPEFSTFAGNVGNLAIIPKVLLSESDETVFAAGLGIELPTGDDVTGRVFGGTYRFANDAVHLSPYVSAAHLSSERLFWIGFLQFDFATNGNLVTVTDPGLGNANLGTYTDQNLCFADLAGGYSFYINPEARLLTRLSGQVELHYAGVLQDADQLVNQRGPLNLNLTPVASNIHIVNITCALTGTLGENTFLRIATSAPLRDAPNRFFDSEIQAAVIQRF